ncbi:hypothetical protein TWF106_008451 [Orbilia oligospora]|uniref:Uncharacterized protein n=1 Tax=Orbilia oligospora TaxID=2813651 RepID=A0A6G1LUB4_ORBOL|nr:hypothetical protein TWF788_002603 [Orbilia oligospora]KAF3215122.1 hypothetical protein TWF191_009415 [Orbilia oligospora]KAF3222535.1 hypothetical protein TWF679_006006 [Orbilia oligospora]KAF3228049.1 hypothetical protein TWF106_008451 [Orbilia oligospora]KAF3234330.1 hypothetical protein TWF192_001564 [Orbilia oligospora]
MQGLGYIQRLLAIDSIDRLLVDRCFGSARLFTSFNPYLSRFELTSPRVTLTDRGAATTLNILEPPFYSGTPTTELGLTSRFTTFQGFRDLDPLRSRLDSIITTADLLTFKSCIKH